jgi:hypothetical protein
VTLNKDVFVRDPLQTKIPNDGVAQVARPQNPHQWEVLEWELKSFVCEGEYERGLERILDTFLTNLDQAQQPAVWVSGFYGSGKSHLCRVLEYLWREVELPNGQTARSLVDLPGGIKAHLRELSIAGKRFGGLWSAAGTLGAGKSQQVRLAFLSVLFDSAGLPEQYPLADFTIWARENGYFDSIEAALDAAGKTYQQEVHHLHVSPIIANALIEADPTLGDTVFDVRRLLQAQFPPRIEDVTDDQMFKAIEDVLRLQSTAKGRYPLTLVVLDEMQQYLGDDQEKTLAVQNIVQGVSARFENSILFVATGQSAMGATPTLQKLTDRFTVQVPLSDKDVETVVRQVILRKKADRRDEIQGVLDQVIGEIDRHLGGTKIQPVGADRKDLVSDYPLLPTRRRFWELALRALDRAGKAGVLRTQLRVIHEATREVGDRPLGHVVGGDFIYDQQAPALQQSGVLLKEIDELIRSLKAERPDGELKSRICALIFLISHVPTQMVGTGSIGLRATAPFIADLLVEDLRSDGARIRKGVPELLDELVEAGRLMRIDDEYRLQTEEGAEWEREYRSRRAAVHDDAAKLATLRNEWLHRTVDSAIGNLKLTQGKSKTPRRIRIYYGPDEPPSSDADVPVWIQDEWSVSEATVRTAAARAGDESPIVFVLLPKRDAESIKDALASHAAAKMTMELKPTPQTEGGKEALRAMKGRAQNEEDRLAELFGRVVQNARVYQGGGNEISSTTFPGAIDVAAQRALVRLFPKFEAADDPNWGKVSMRAREGAPDPLEPVGHAGPVAMHPVCKEMLATISGAGTKGADLDRRFSAPQFGWGQDAVRGAALALLVSGHVRATQGGIDISAKQLEPRQIGKTTFYKEDEPPTLTQRMAVRGLLAAAQILYESNQEQAQIAALLQKLEDLAAEAGGKPPLPEPPDTSHIAELQLLGGNQQFRAVADDYQQLRQNLEEWRKAVQRKEERFQEWNRLETLLQHGRNLPGTEEIRTQRDAIFAGRHMLVDPNPLSPLLADISEQLQEQVKAAADRLRTKHAEVMAELESSDEWQRIGSEAKKEILAKASLQPHPPVDLSGQTKLVAALNQTPLESWAEKVELIGDRASRARAEAAKRLEPTAVRLTLAPATLKTHDDVEHYLDETRRTIIERIEEGHIVII